MTCRPAPFLFFHSLQDISVNGFTKHYGKSKSELANFILKDGQRDGEQNTFVLFLGPTHSPSGRSSSACSHPSQSGGDGVGHSGAWLGWETTEER
jgi:hypothetical protein